MHYHIAHLSTSLYILIFLWLHFHYNYFITYFHIHSHLFLSLFFHVLPFPTCPVFLQYTVYIHIIVQVGLSCAPPSIGEQCGTSSWTGPYTTLCVGSLDVRDWMDPLWRQVLSPPLGVRVPDAPWGGLLSPSLRYSSTARHSMPMMWDARHQSALVDCVRGSPLAHLPPSITAGDFWHHDQHQLWVMIGPLIRGLNIFKPLSRFGQPWLESPHGSGCIPNGNLYMVNTSFFSLWSFIYIPNNHKYV